MFPLNIWKKKHIVKWKTKNPDQHIAQITHPWKLNYLKLLQRHFLNFGHNYWLLIINKSLKSYTSKKLLLTSNKYATFYSTKNEFVCNSVTLLFKDENPLQMSVLDIQEYTMFQ